MPTDLNRGMLIRIHGELYQVTDFGEQHTGKQKSKTHVSLRNLRTGMSTDKLLETLLPIEEVPHENRNLQFLYTAGGEYTFMDAESFEQYTLADHALGRSVQFLIEGESYRALFADGLPVSLLLPDVMVMDVADTAPPSHSPSGGSHITKEAVLANGKQVHVPLFIKVGDRIRVDTRTEKYLGKES
jgi:elongation factor P